MGKYLPNDDFNERTIKKLAKENEQSEKKIEEVLNDVMDKIAKTLTHEDARDLYIQCLGTFKKTMRRLNILEYNYRKRKEHDEHSINALKQVLRMKDFKMREHKLLRERIAERKEKKKNDI